jgi:hypothetical protein
VKIWTASEVEVVVGEATAAIASVVHLLRTTSISPADDVVAWGQYLDDEHNTGQQWGLYGIAAGAQILSMERHVAGERACEDPLVGGALRLLPEDPDESDALLDGKREKGDFRNVLKLAAIAEALRPDARSIALDVEPPLVTRLRELTLSEGGWTTRPANSPEREVRERELATAYILYAWRRYDLGDDGLRARRWLARRLVEGLPIKGLDLVALIGLALTAHPSHPNDPPIVERAIGKVDQRLSDWARPQSDLRIDRPAFNGFSVLGDKTDYLFLHPEMLAALYFLTRGNPEQTRGFVVSVVRAVSANVTANRGLSVSNGVVATVDQLWVMRLLLTFRTRYSEEGLESVSPASSEREVREIARARWESGRGDVRESVRLWLSSEAGLRRRLGEAAVVVMPLVAALVLNLLLFEKSGEAIASAVGGVLISLGMGYLFWFKGRGSGV